MLCLTQNCIFFDFKKKIDQRSQREGTYIKHLAKRLRTAIFSLARIQILTLVNMMINFPIPQTPDLKPKHFVSWPFIWSLLYASTYQNLHNNKKIIKTLYLTLILLTCKIWWAPNNVSRWQIGFNSALKRWIPSLFTLVLESPKILRLVLFKIAKSVQIRFKELCNINTTDRTSNLIYSTMPIAKKC